MHNYYFIAGASGSGKTAIMPELKKILGESVAVYDFDDIGVPEGADKIWRQQSTEKWLQKLLAEDTDVCLLGQIVLGELLACPSANQLGRVNFCLLDVSDFVRIQRLRARNTYGIDQNMLNWASWLRMHHQDPQWMQHVLKDNAWDGLDFRVWDSVNSWENQANIILKDTTQRTVSEVAQSVAYWIDEKAGFKKVAPQSNSSELWMILAQQKHASPLETIQALIQERYPKAKAVFWAGSVSQNKGTIASDLDLIIVFEKIPNAYREAFVYEGWPIDAFVLDFDSLCLFLEEARAGNGISGLSTMILNGREVLQPSEFSEQIKKFVQTKVNEGPQCWTQEIIDKERFLITDALEDIKFPVSQAEQMASVAWLLEAIGQFYFRAQNKWCASGKSLMRYLHREDARLAKEFTKGFGTLFKHQDTTALEQVVQKILAPYGGFLWHGFNSQAPKPQPSSNV